MDDRRIALGGAIKSLGGDKFGGYLVRFYEENERDLHGEWFDETTDFCLEDYPVEGIPTLFHHGLDPVIGIQTTGRITKAVKDKYGIWAEGVYDGRREYIDHVKRMVDDGILEFSSGALPQSVVVDEKTHHIDRWAMIEASKTWSPADWRGVVGATGTRISALRSITELRLPEGENQRVTNSDSLPSDTDRTPIEGVKTIDSETPTTENGVTKMTADELRGILAEIMSQLEGAEPAMETAAMDELTKADAEFKPDEEQNEEQKAVKLQNVVNAGIKAVQAAIAKRKNLVAGLVTKGVTDLRSAPGVSIVHQTGIQSGKPNNTPRVSVGESQKYAHLSAETMALAVKMLVGARPEYARKGLTLGDVVSEDFARHVAHKMTQTVSALSEPVGEMAIRDRIAVKSAIPFKADELDSVAITGQGAEWAETFYDTRLWDYARHQVQLLQLLESKGMRTVDIPQGAKGMNVKLITSSPTVYTRGEPRSVASDGRPEVTVAITPVGTSEVEADAVEHYLATAYSHQLDEDSIINIAQAFNEDINTTFPEAIEDSFINGDIVTTVNTNINLIDGTPATGLTKPLYLAFDGIRKQWLVTNTDYRRDLAGVALTINDYEETIMLLPSAVQQRRANMLFVVDYKTQSKTRRLSELLTVDVAGESRATLFAGKIPAIFDVDFYMSGFMRLSNGDGKISATGSNNVKGTLSCVYAPYWQYGRKRALQIETARDIMSGSTVFVASARHILKARGAGAASGTFDILV